MQGMTSVGGLSKARLGRMRDIMAGHVDSGSMPGLVTLVSRHGEVHVDVIGRMAFGGAPMQRDSIFRITSMTKPVTAAAAMILIEECKLRLDDPVDPGCRNWRIEKCCAQSMRRLTTPCRPDARSRCAIS
jgi:CubicO group peptidase (beta-lactamase class C family)